MFKIVMHNVIDNAQTLVIEIPPSKIAVIKIYKFSGSSKGFTLIEDEMLKALVSSHKAFNI